MFKTKAEKNAYKAGIKKGRRGGTVWKHKNKSVKVKRKILPVNRDRYYVENHFVDLVDNVHDINTSYHSSYKAALAQARKQEAHDKKMADHPSIAKTWFTITGPVKGKAKIIKREKNKEGR